VSEKAWYESLESNERPGYLPPDSFRTDNYRVASCHSGAIGGGARVGMPARPEDADGTFTDWAAAGESAAAVGGDLNGFGRFLARNGDLERFAGAGTHRAGSRPVTYAERDDDYPEQVSETDREPEGTPGRGDRLEDEYSGYGRQERGSEATRALRVAQARVVQNRELLYRACQMWEQAEKAGRQAHAAHFEDKANQLTAEIEQDQALIAELEAPGDDVPTGMSF